MNLDQEIAQAESAVRDQEEIVRSKITPFATALAAEVANYAVSEVRRLVIENYRETEDLGVESVAKLRSEVESVVEGFTERAVELFTRDDQMIYAGYPKRDVVQRWGVANHEPLWVQVGLRHLLDPVNRVVRECYGPGSSVPQDDLMREDAFSSPGRYPVVVKEALKDYREERSTLGILQKAADDLKVQLRRNAVASVWDAGV